MYIEKKIRLRLCCTLRGNLRYDEAAWSPIPKARRAAVPTRNHVSDFVSAWNIDQVAITH